MDFKLELVLVPVSDVDRAKAFYTEKAGFGLDVDHAPNDEFRVVQMTPPGSACSITIGKGITRAEPGSYRGTHLVVTDIEAARDVLMQARCRGERHSPHDSERLGGRRGPRARGLRVVRRLRRSGRQHVGAPGGGRRQDPVVGVGVSLEEAASRSQDRGRRAPRA
jgi:catechol 2,3-dioxygenase-like lactoylglutathione lyase family enzyme